MSFFIRKCRVRVSFYFFPMLCVMAFFDRRGFLLRGMLAALLHEGGHLAAMVLLPENAPREVSLTPFGIRIERSPLSEFGRGNGIILAAGSGMNFLCAAVTFGFLPAFAAVSLLLGIFNLLPVEGLDGGGIGLLLLSRFMPGGTAGTCVKILSWVTLLGIAALGIYVLIDTGYNFSLLGAALALAIRYFADSL